MKLNRDLQGPQEHQAPRQGRPQGAGRGDEMSDEELAAKLSRYGADLASAKYRALTCITHQDSGALMNLASERLYALSAKCALLGASLAQAEHEADVALAALPDSYSQSKDWLATKDLVGRIEVLKALHQGAMENREIGWKAAEYAANRIKKLTAELDTERQRLAACGVVAFGYFDGCADEYKSASLGDVLRLRAEVERLRGLISAIAKATGKEAQS